jgi:hypothetical protein
LLVSASKQSALPTIPTVLKHPGRGEGGLDAATKHKRAVRFVGKADGVVPARRKPEVHDSCC